LRTASRSVQTPSQASAAMPIDVADREDMRHVGAQLAVGLDEASVGDCHAGLVGADLLNLGRARRPGN
jgi:hypothetical protein